MVYGLLGRSRGGKLFADSALVHGGDRIQRAGLQEEGDLEHIRWWREHGEVSRHTSPFIIRYVIFWANLTSIVDVLNQGVLD